MEKVDELLLPIIANGANTRRNVAKGDYVIPDKDICCYEWELGRVINTVYGKDNIVRRIEIEYNKKGSLQFTNVIRSAQKVIVIYPIEDQYDVGP